MYQFSIIIIIHGGEIVLVDMPICSINNTFYISFIWFCNILNKAARFNK
jgi:hypothetical protein